MCLLHRHRTSWQFLPTESLSIEHLFAFEFITADCGYKMNKFGICWNNMLMPVNVATVQCHSFVGSVLEPFETIRTAEKRGNINCDALQFLAYNSHGGDHIRWSLAFSLLFHLFHFESESGVTFIKKADSNFNLFYFIYSCNNKIVVKLCENRRWSEATSNGFHVNIF